MDAFLTFLAETVATQKFFQVCVGGCTMWLIGWMVTRGRSDRDALLVSAHGHPSPVAHALPEMIDLVRDQRDMDRRRTEDTDHIRDAVRDIREETRKQTDILERMAESQRIHFALTADRDRRGAERP